MKKKSLIALLAVASMILVGCGKGKKPSSSDSSESEPPTEETSTGGDTSGGEQVTHQDPFVSTVTNPTTTRQYREEFDEMIEDFSSATPSGETTGEFNKSFLRVLVDSADVNEPTSPDAAIYKMATGNYQIASFEGIGFRMRKVGNGFLNLSNLVLGLRGDDAFKVFGINLAEALNPDGEPLPELTGEFQDVIVAPGQSIEDANTVYELAAGGNSETKVLDQILGFHLFALDEECSAIVEIEKVFLVNAGEVTDLDVFAREDVTRADPTCWWRGSTGFIVQKGVTLDGGKKYTTKAVEKGEYENLVMNVMGDTSGLKLNGVAYSALKDDQERPLTGAVNGAFYSYVINLSKSNMALADGKFVFESATPVVISKLFLTNLVNEAPASEYPAIDIANASYVTKFDFNVEKGTFKTNYDDAVLDTRVTDAGLNYVISYAGNEHLESKNGQLTIEGGNYDYANIVIGSNAVAEGKQYLVFAYKSEGNLAGLRVKCGSNPEVWAPNWVADAGLPSIPTELGYPYVTEGGFKLAIIDLARSGFAAWNNEVIIYYTGAEDLVIDSIFFANKYVPEAKIEETLMYENTIAASADDYAYVGGYDLPADAKYVHIVTTATAENLLRFEGNNGAKWMNQGQIIGIDGQPVAEGTTDFIIDLVASDIKVVGETSPFHTHSHPGAGFTITVKLYKVLPAFETVENGLINATVNASADDYAYVGGADLGADVAYVHVKTNATAANLLRFEGSDGAKWMNQGQIIGKDGQAVAEGATDFIIDLAASGLKEVGKTGPLHVHSCPGEGFEIRVLTYAEEPVKHVFETPMYTLDVNASADDYAYVGGYDLPASARYVHIVTTADAYNLLRFEGNNGAKWMNQGQIIGIDGQPVAEGTTDFVIDLVASGIKNVGETSPFHTHSCPDKGFHIEVSLYTVLVDGSYEHLLSGYAG